MATDESDSFAPAIEMRSLSRFFRLFDVATNLCTRTNGEVHITFVVLFAFSPQLQSASVFAVRIFRGKNAQDVDKILNTVYNVEQKDGESLDQNVQANIEMVIKEAWLARFLDSEYVPKFPRLFCYFIDPLAYRDKSVENLISRSRPMELFDDIADSSNDRDGVRIEEWDEENEEDDEEIEKEDDDFLDDEKELRKKALRNRWATDDISISSLFRDGAADGSSCTFTALNSTRCLLDLPPCFDASTNTVNHKAFVDWYENFDLVRADDDYIKRPHYYRWIVAHHFTDSVLFDKFRIQRMVKTSEAGESLFYYSRRWTLPLLCFLINRKINDIFSRKERGYRSQDFTQVQYDIDFYNHKARSLAVCTQQCRSRAKLNLVIPSEWLHSKLLPWYRLQELVGCFARPDESFARLCLSNTAEMNEESFEEFLANEEAVFWSMVLKLKEDEKNTPEKSTQVRAKNSAILQTLFGRSSCSFKRPKVEEKPKPKVDKRRTKLHYFVVGDKSYGLDNEDNNDNWKKYIRFVSSSHLTPRRRSVVNGTRKFFKKNTAVSGATGLAVLGIECLQQPEETKETKRSRKRLELAVTDFAHWEQGLLIDFGVRFLSRNHSINVNGDPGTGKSTVMWYLLNRFSRSMCSVPTNKMKYQVETRLKQMRDKGSFRFKKSAVSTVSSLVKRLGCFHMSPSDYSAVVKNCYEEASLRATKIQLRYNTVDSEFFNVIWSVSKKPKKNRILLPPDGLLIDEVNMCLWQHLAFIRRLVEPLRTAVIMFGDSGQNRPIDSTADNADLISLTNDLVVQLLANKRLKENNRSGGEKQKASPLAQILMDNVWNLNVSNNNFEMMDTVAKYVRALICDAFVGTSLIDNVRIDLTAEVDRWCCAVEKLNEYFIRRPCKRFPRELADVLAISDMVPKIQQKFFIAQRNSICDRFSYWYSYAFYDTLSRRVFTEDKDNEQFLHFYALLYQRSAFVPRKLLHRIPASQVRYDDASFDPVAEAALENESMSGENEREKPERLIRGSIVDDPWVSVTVFCVGFVYVYLGTAKCLPPNALLRLIHVVPNEKSGRFYTCTDQECKDCVKKRCCPRLLDFDCEKFDRQISGFLCEIVDQNGKPIEKPEDKFVFIAPEYYYLNRYNSYWSSRDGNFCPREGSKLYGYPLRLYSSMTSYKIQGETLYEEVVPEIHVDLSGMERNAALVSLSRVTSNDQLKSILNVDLCCPAFSNNHSSSFKRMKL